MLSSSQPPFSPALLLLVPVSLLQPYLWHRHQYIHCKQHPHKPGIYNFTNTEGPVSFMLPDKYHQLQDKSWEYGKSYMSQAIIWSNADILLIGL